MSVSQSVTIISERDTSASENWSHLSVGQCFSARGQAAPSPASPAWTPGRTIAHIHIKGCTKISKSFRNSILTGYMLYLYEWRPKMQKKNDFWEKACRITTTPNPKSQAESILQCLAWAWATDCFGNHQKKRITPAHFNWLPLKPLWVPIS